MEIEKIAKKIKQNGGNTYLVGGAVRDAILNKEMCISRIFEHTHFMLIKVSKIIKI